MQPIFFHLLKLKKKKKEHAHTQYIFLIRYKTKQLSSVVLFPKTTKNAVAIVILFRFHT